MTSSSSGLMDIMCTAVEIKERMRAFYADAAGKCNDKLGSKTFEMLREMEQKDLDRLNAIYADLSKAPGELDACRFYDFEPLDRSEIIKKLKQERKKVENACLDDVAAIEGGMELENKGIEFFMSRLKEAAGPVEREFLNHMIAEERSHYIMLADLKFYYVDTAHWFMEQSRAGLDGA